MTILVGLLALALGADPVSDPTILPGVLDFPILEGAAISPDCGGVRGLEGPELQCITAPIERINDLINAYISEAQRRGWQDLDGAANAFWMSRRSVDGCQRLTVVGFWDYRRHPTYRDGLPAFVGFAVEPTNRCS